MNVISRATNKLKFYYRHFIGRVQQARFIGQSAGTDIELRLSDLPRRATAGFPLSASVCVVNTGSQSWPGRDFSVVARWRLAGTSEDYFFDDVGHATLPALAPGEKTTFAVLLTAPDAAGAFDLAFDIAHNQGGKCHLTSLGQHPTCRVHEADLTLLKQSTQQSQFAGHSGELAIELRTELPRHATVGFPLTAPVCAVNTGSRAWPGGAFCVGVRWRLPGLSNDFCLDLKRADVPALGPGEKATFQVPLTAPNTAHEYEVLFDVSSTTGQVFPLAPTGRVPRCRVDGADPRDGRKGFDYRKAYAALDLDKDYWTIVGPRTREEFETLGRGKMDALIRWGMTPDSRILDVGCGTGQLAQPLMDYLSDKGAYCGTDLAEPAIEFCKRKYRRANFRFYANDMTTLPISGEQFDIIFLSSVFTHMFPEEVRAMLLVLRELLAAGGVIIADAFHSQEVNGHVGSRDMVVMNEGLLLEIFASVGLKKSDLSSFDWNPTTRRTIFGLAKL